MSTEQLQQLAETKFDIKVAKLNLLERVNSQLTFTHADGQFKADEHFLCLLDVYANAGYETIVILDEYQNPIEINVQEIKHKAIESHQYALNAYKKEYDELKRVRKGDKL